MLKSILIAEEGGERLFELVEVNGGVKFPTGTLIVVKAACPTSAIKGNFHV